MGKYLSRVFFRWQFLDSVWRFRLSASQILDTSNASRLSSAKGLSRRPEMLFERPFSICFESFANPHRSHTAHVQVSGDGSKVRKRPQQGHPEACNLRV